MLCVEWRKKVPHILTCTLDRLYIIISKFVSARISPIFLETPAKLIQAP